MSMEKPDAPAPGEDGEVLRAGGAASAFVRIVDTADGPAVRKDFSRSSALVRFTVGVLMARREARAYARLGGVAGVPRLLSRPSADGLLLERIEGRPCAGPGGGAVTQAYFDDLDALLGRLRSRGVLHGDVKRNALVTPTGGAALVDFGASFVVPAWAGPLGRTARSPRRPLRRTLDRAPEGPRRAGPPDAPRGGPRRGPAPVREGREGRRAPSAAGGPARRRWRRREDPAVKSPGEPAFAPPAPRHPAAVYLVLLAATALVVALTLNALPLTDPDEVFYAQTAREMLATPSPLTPLFFGQPQFEKPPLTYWLLAASFALLGEHPWTARLVPAFFGLLGALATFFFGRRFLPNGVAALGALVLLTSLAYLGQSIALLTDMVFTTLVAGAFFVFYLWYDRRRSAYLHGFALLAALAVLTKGPVALVMLLPAAILFLLLPARPVRAPGVPRPPLVARPLRRRCVPGTCTRRSSTAARSPGSSSSTTTGTGSSGRSIRAWTTGTSTPA